MAKVHFMKICFWLERGSALPWGDGTPRGNTGLLVRSGGGGKWINNTISGSNWEADQRILGYQSPDGLASSSAGIVEALVFPTSSNIT